MTTIIDWPRAQFSPRQEDWHLAGSTPTSAGGIFGPGTLINVENRVWKLETEIVFYNDTAFRTARAVMDEARGQYGVVRVPVLAQDGIDAAASATVTFDGGVTFDGAVVFSGYSTTTGVVARSAVAGATLIELTLPPSFVATGTMFTIAECLYRTSGVVSGRLRINPPLRKAIAAGDEVELAEPTALMRFTTEDSRIVRTQRDNPNPAPITMTEALI